MEKKAVTITVPARLDGKCFRRFAWFNSFVRQKRWVSPLIFSLILTVFAVVILITGQDKAALLSTVLLTVGLGLPVVYVWTFFSQVKQQVKRFRLDPPRLVYSVTLGEDGIRAENHVQSQDPQETAWGDTWKAFRQKDCIYLFVSENRAFLLPAGQADVPDEDLWAFLVDHMGQDKCSSAIR